MDEFSIIMWINEEGFSNEYGDAYLFFSHDERFWLEIHNHYAQYAGVFRLLLQFAEGGYRHGTNLISKPFDKTYRNRWICYALVYRSGILYAYINGELVDPLS